MWLIVGLGNPGSAYDVSRHNIGFMVIDRLAKEFKAGFRRAPYHSLSAASAYHGHDLVLIKPQTYMNRSGYAVQAALNHYAEVPEHIIVVYDDMDLEPGKIRVRARGSSGGHKGIGSIIACLGTQDVKRVRIGIGHPPPTHDAADYVLRSFDREELSLISQAILDGANAVKHIMVEGVESAQGKFNSGASQPE